MKLVSCPVTVSTYAQPLVQHRERESRVTDLDLLPCSVHDPLLCLFPLLVEQQKPALASPLNQLVWLRNKFVREYPLRHLGVGSDGIGRLVP